MRVGEPFSPYKAFTGIPILWSVVKTGDHRAALVLGVFLGRWLDGITGPVSVTDLSDRLDGMFKRSSVKSALKRLLVGGFVIPDRVSAQEIRSMLCRDIPPPPERHCPWCKTPSRRLHQHHWPIGSNDGGTETIGICHPCHMEYHIIERRATFAVTDKAIELGIIYMSTVDKRSVLRYH